MTIIRLWWKLSVLLYLCVNVLLHNGNDAKTIFIVIVYYSMTLWVCRQIVCFPTFRLTHLTVSHLSWTSMASTPPHNFSWVEPGKLAGLAQPRMTSEYQYLLDNGIKHLVCLCERKPPYHDTCPDLKLHHIKIVDFTPPSPGQIERFLDIVEEANSQGEVGSRPASDGRLLASLVLHDGKTSF